MPLTSPLYRIALTPGEPAGIGLDLCIKIAMQKQTCELVILTDPALLAERAQHLNASITIQTFQPSLAPTLSKVGTIKVLPIKRSAPVTPGYLDKRNAQHVLNTIKQAAEGCLSGLFDAMVTGPVNKGIINDAGIAFSGHTEYIANITGQQPVMMLTTPGLRVALVTTHLPLKDIPDAITQQQLTHVISTVHHDLQQRFGINNPTLLVAGLNPHAGENGHLGDEEITTIIPVLAALRDQGLNLMGPLPADTLFTPKYLDRADAVIAMYHDQGLPVLKHKGFGNAVNITLGLPVIRTSVDHGTALDLAGSGLANENSLICAIDTAQQLIRH
ncbi:MAG TPA: 4-hydroxythreonine-4-phosphate dehydrogenase PdxA [Methylococcaceae bacterium]|nr:4-hydroxythreonine-4-phosphate dehydrogenase PdxA [Methylococcaceae bacterium]